MGRKIFLEYCKFKIQSRTPLGDSSLLFAAAILK
jgi:hypothetical protein